jgi:hypothetical protein
MRTLVALLVLSAAWVAAAAPARAEVGSVFVSGYGGFGGTQTDQLMPGGDDPDLGGALGLQGGARVFGLEAYVDRTEYDDGGVTRGVIGVRPSLSVGGLRLAARAGAGVISEDGVLSGDPGRDRRGVVARAGASLEKDLGSRLSLGLGVESEVFAVWGDEDDMGDGETGNDVLGALHLRFELGL